MKIGSTDFHFYVPMPKAHWCFTIEL